MYESIEIEPARASVTLPLGGSATQAYTVYGVAEGYAKKDITASCTLSIDAQFGSFADATVTVQGRGGKTPILATCDALSGEAQIIVNLTGSVTIGGAPANAADLFNGATASTDAARMPLIEYPIDRAVSPRNIPPVETQWTAAGNDLFHLRLASGFLAIDVYSATPEALLPADEWKAITETAAGDNLAFTVEGLAQAAPATKYASTPVTVTMSTDTIDNTAIYYWASSQGNVMSQTFGSPEPPSVVMGNCTSCHTVNRSGSRVGYSRCVGGCGHTTQRVGFLTYDSVTKTWVEKVNADTSPIMGSYLSFAPVGNPFPDDTKAVAAVTRNDGTMALYDGDTGAEVPSNLSIANTPDAATRSALMPDWSPDGNTLVYVSGSPGAWVDLNDGKIATMSYSFAGGNHTFGSPQMIVSDPITLTNGTYNNFFFPSFSPDNNVIVFNAARASWRSGGATARDPGQRLMLTTPTGAWKQDLTAANGGFVDTDITWAHWAPTVSNEYYWIVFSSQRDYGHRTTIATSPASCKQNKVEQCKQIWLTAIARNKLNGQVDPSAPPMWLPGQDPLANNISPYWSRPGIIQ
ncbi:MAG: hypothetical protein SFX73_00965 [Kofleriaceae bacterium]|nr:hypothetical protein [Kofleriaceae bacterium]